jgi:hypothetical protein
MNFNNANRMRLFPYSGFVFNALAFMVIAVFGIAVFFAGLKPWGGVINSAGWAGILTGFLFIVWFVLARASGVLNFIVMVVICWSAFTGKDGAVHHTVNLGTVAQFIRFASASNSYDVVREIGGYTRYSKSEGGDIDVELVQNYKQELEYSWNNYGTFVNDWYTQERFTEAWQSFYTWFSDHDWPKNGSPPIVPYFGTIDQIKKMQERYEYHRYDKHRGEHPGVVAVLAPKPATKPAKREWLIDEFHDWQRDTNNPNGTFGDFLNYIHKDD